MAIAKRRSSPGASSMSAVKAATRRPSSARPRSATPVSTIAGQVMSRPKAPEKARTHRFDLRGCETSSSRTRLRARNRCGCSRTAARRRGSSPEPAGALVRALVERHVEKWRDPELQRRSAMVLQRQQPHVARKIRRNEDLVGRRQRAAPLRQGRDARFVGDLDRRIWRAGTARSRSRRSRRLRGCAD